MIRVRRKRGLADEFTVLEQVLSWDEGRRKAESNKCVHGTMERWWDPMLDGVVGDPCTLTCMRIQHRMYEELQAAASWHVV